MKIIVRNRQRKPTIGMFTEESMKKAVVMVINGSVSIRSCSVPKNCPHYVYSQSHKKSL